MYLNLDHSLFMLTPRLTSTLNDNIIGVVCARFYIAVWKCTEVIEGWSFYQKVHRYVLRYRESPFGMYRAQKFADRSDSRCANNAKSSSHMAIVLKLFSLYVYKHVDRIWYGEGGSGSSSGPKHPTSTPKTKYSSGLPAILRSTHFHRQKKWD